MAEPAYRVDARTQQVSPICSPNHLANEVETPIQRHATSRDVVINTQRPIKVSPVPAQVAQFESPRDESYIPD
jgi:hypothetical protein